MVYVDDAKLPRYGRDWFHLTADSLEELHAFAVNIGLPAQAFHRGARHPHYDVTERQRLKAIRGGALRVTAREVVRVARQAAVGASNNALQDHDLQRSLFA